MALEALAGEDTQVSKILSLCSRLKMRASHVEWARLSNNDWFPMTYRGEGECPLTMEGQSVISSVLTLEGCSVKVLELNPGRMSRCFHIR